MAHPLPASSSSICLNYGQARVQNPLCLPRFRRTRRPLKSAHGELQTSEPTAAMTASTSITTRRVTVHDRERGVVNEFLVPEDQYILHTAESQNITLPFACRHASFDSSVDKPYYKVKKLEGYALLCVGFPSSDIEVETQDEDEERDDYALELAMDDE